MEESIKYLKEQFDLQPVDIRTYSPVVLAYIGDAVYELVIRTILVDQGNRQANTLHKKASTYVKASAQAAMAEAFLPELTEEELSYFKRGRNAKTVSMAKHATMHDYRHATGFEALMGYLYLSGRTERMVDLVALAMTKTGKADSGDTEKQKEENSDEI